MFVASDRGGRTAATLYSLVGSCKRHRVDPFAYFKDILELRPSIPPIGLGNSCPMPGSQ
jgi:transposase